jgi:hypothetical protein
VPGSLDLDQLNASSGTARILEGRAGQCQSDGFLEDTLRYLYLPRLKTREDLAHVIRKEPRFFGTHTLEPDPENCFPIHGPSAR